MSLVTNTPAIKLLFALGVPMAAWSA